MENVEGHEEIAVVEDSTPSEPEEFHDAEPTPVQHLSMHALTGSFTAASTFTLKLQFGKHIATALVDTGSDISFMQAKFAIKSKCHISSVEKIKVAVANGASMLSETACLNYPYSIQGFQFSSDFRLLEVQGYDVILGNDWILAHSLVGLNLKTREFSVIKDGTSLLAFRDENIVDKRTTISTKKLYQLLRKKACSSVLVLNTQLIGDTEVLSPSQIPPDIASVLKEFTDVFKEPDQLPPKRKVDHAIALLDESQIVSQRPYRFPFHQKNVMEELIKHMLQSQQIRPSLSPFASPIILVKKKDGTWRMCVDYRQLNSNTVKNKCPIPIIENLLDELYGAQIFSKIDLRPGYHQIRMKAEDIPKTAFTTHLGHFEYVVMPFGLTNAPATFQFLMNDVLSEFLRKFALVFFDDILIYSNSLSDHIHYLRSVLQVLCQHQLFAKMGKCTFGQTEIEYLGHVISKNGVAIDPAKIQIIQQWPSPKNITQLRAFLGLIGYYRRFIKGYGVICRPLFDALKKNSFVWCESQEKAFQHLKLMMSTPPVLALPNFNEPFVLEADASGQGIGAVIMQQGKPIAFFIKSLGPKAAAASTYEKEALAILEALKKWNHYFASTSLIIKTYQQSLKYIQEQKLVEGIQHKLLIKLLGYNYIVEYKKGKENKAADTLSRAPHAQQLLTISSVLPAWIEQVT